MDCLLTWDCEGHTRWILVRLTDRAVVLEHLDVDVFLTGEIYLKKKFIIKQQKYQKELTEDKLWRWLRALLSVERAVLLNPTVAWMIVLGRDIDDDRWWCWINQTIKITRNITKAILDFWEIDYVDGEKVLWLLVESVEHFVTTVRDSEMSFL